MRQIAFWGWALLTEPTAETPASSLRLDACAFWIAIQQYQSLEMQICLIWPRRPTARKHTRDRRHPWRQRVIDCMEAIMRERNSNSRIALRATAGGGERFALVLDFEFLSRPRSAMQTTEICPPLTSEEIDRSGKFLAGYYRKSRTSIFCFL